MQGILLEVVCNSVILLYKLCFFLFKAFIQFRVPSLSALLLKILLLLEKLINKGKLE